MSVEIFAVRARQLRSARDLVVLDENYASATALLAVHAAIALNDALLSAWRGKPLKGLDHGQAVIETRRQCSVRRLDGGGLRHLEKLIASKSMISYGDETVTAQKASVLVETAKRFETWTFKHCKELAAWDR